MAFFQSENWHRGSFTAGTLQVMPFETHMCDPPSTRVKTTKDELLGWYETMFKIRRMEVTTEKLYQTKLIRGFCHSYNGQEAIVTGLHAGCTMQDSIITSYRDHAFPLFRGGTLKEVIGELMGKSVGGSLGLGGSMHFYSKENNFYGGCGIVGAQVCLYLCALNHRVTASPLLCAACIQDFTMPNQKR
jgi:pyruvate dehydrogenase E1 component alpha subunit